MFDINQLFSPLSWAEFISEYFEKKHLLIARKDPHYYDEVVTLKDVDEVIFSQKINHPAFRVVDSKTGEFPDPRRYTQNGTSSINPVEFCREYTEGGTLALAGMQHHVRSLREFCNNLQRAYGHPAQTNLYLTPQDAQGFSPHYDNHDVIVLQIHGKKHWRLYESDMNLPDKSMPFQKEGFTPGKVFKEFDLNAGDLLYIPRGLVHDAITTDESSLHVTLGVLGYTWSQLLIESVVKLTEENKEFRHFVSEGMRSTDYDQHFKTLLSKLEEDLRERNGIRRFSKQLEEQTPSENVGHLLNLLDSSSNQGPEEFAIIEGVSLEENGEAISFKKGFKEVSFPIFCKNTCEELVTRGERFSRSHLDKELDDEGIDVMISRLLREGIIKRV
ncbi:MAG: cupin domain-containing protein [Flavobacteriales bacterium]|nr:cupin domain-containing protein [Flavobacteriales bacterium]